MADPRPYRGGPARASESPAVVQLRAARPPRPANDNTFPWLRRLPGLLPLLAALGLLIWALVHALDH